LRRLILLLVVAGAIVAHAATVRTGDTVPDFTLPDRGGTPVSLAAMRGKVVCIEFWASWCPACRAMLPVLDQVAHRLGGADVAVVAIDIDEERATADRFLAERLPDPAVRVLYDPGGSVMARFGTASMPAVYVIDRRGVVRLIADENTPDLAGTIERQVRALVADHAR
jgi:thiol-disulfide isomerase/thioredoxin